MDGRTDGWILILDVGILTYLKFPPHPEPSDKHCMLVPSYSVHIHSSVKYERKVSSLNEPLVSENSTKSRLSGSFRGSRSSSVTKTERKETTELSAKTAF